MKYKKMQIAPNEVNNLLPTPAEQPRSYDPRCGRGLKTFLLLGGGVVAAAAWISLKTRSPSDESSIGIFLGDKAIEFEGRPKTGYETAKSPKASKEPDCDDGNYAKRTLQLAYELPFASLFSDNKGSRSFEASSLTLSDDKKTAYAVCDSSYAISKFGTELTPFSDSNRHIGEVDRESGEESEYEAIFRDQDAMYVVRESIEHNDAATGGLQGYHAVIEEIILGEDSYDVTQTCSAQFEFDGDNKGFEGAVGIHDLNDNLLILGLCEGNHCSSDKYKKNDIGNGIVVVMRKETSDDGSCTWKTVRQLNVPRSALFLDYADITITPSGRVGIVSQENSQFWVGQLLGQQEGGLWDIDALAFDEDVGTIYDFPRDHDCHIIYCNVEGVYWINDGSIMAVSDKMKGRKQSFRCFDKDQHVHVFLLP